MYSKSLIFACAMMIAASAMAEPVRTVQVLENRRPYEAGLELQSEFGYQEIGSSTEIYGLISQVRYGVTDTFTVYGQVPLLEVDAFRSERERGLGDITLGGELVAYEDIFDYPWVIPFFEVTAETGDEDKGLGAGETRLRAGVAVGTTVYKVLHFVAQVDYAMFDQSPDIPTYGMALLWDLSDRYTVFVEGSVSDLEDAPDELDKPFTYLGGFHYDIDDALSFGIYGGSQNEGLVDTIAGAKVAYSF